MCLPRHWNEVQEWRHSTVGWVSSRRRQPVKSVNCNQGMVDKGLRTGIQILRMVSFTVTTQTQIWKSPFSRHYKERSPALGGGKCQSIHLFSPASFDVTTIWFRKWNSHCVADDWQTGKVEYISASDDADGVVRHSSPWHRMVDNFEDCCRILSSHDYQVRWYFIYKVHICVQ